MAFIVTDSCIECKHTDCVEVCPVDCIPLGIEESDEVLMARYEKLTG